MSKTKCIFKPVRCKKCENLILKSEKHVCKEKPTLRFAHSRRLDLEIGLTFDHLKRKSLRPSEIVKYLKSEFPEQKHDKFNIKWHMKTLPKIYAVDNTISQNKYAEKYYCIINSNNSTTPQKELSKINTKPIYFINPPRTQWGLVYVIKKTTILGEEKTLAMIYGEKLAKTLLQKCKDVQA